MSEEKFKDKAKKFMVGAFATAVVMFGGKAQAQAEKTTEKQEFKKEVSATQKEFEDFQKSNQAEFEEFQNTNKAEFESFQDENRRELDSIRQQARSLKKANMHAVEPSITPSPIQNKPEKTPVYEEKEAKPSARVSKQSVGEKETVTSAVDANFDIKKYEYMRNLLSQALYFMDAVDKKDHGGKVESTKRSYYDNIAHMDATRLARLDDEQVAVYFTKDYPGLEVKEVEGLKFVSYKGLGYEIKPSGQARFDMDSRNVGPNSGIESRIQKAVQRVKSLQSAKAASQQR